MKISNVEAMLLQILLIDFKEKCSCDQKMFLLNYF